jgi:signal transduction histidine kinase
MDEAMRPRVFDGQDSTDGGWSEELQSALGDNPSLEAVLAAWHGATLRLEQTHAALQGEVRRLTDELEKKNRELARQSRLADLGQFASHIAHEVRNNLVPVGLYLGLLRRTVEDDPEGLGVLEKIEHGFRALDATVNELLNFTAERDPRLASISLRGLLDEVCGALQPQMTAQHVLCCLDVERGVQLMADHAMLRRALLNLLLNALDAMPDGGELLVTACATPTGLEIEVADSGPGLSVEAQRRAFEPFFTTKERGTGLGLASVHRMAEIHGGDVTAANCPQGGAAFTIRLPYARRGMAA